MTLSTLIYSAYGDGGFNTSMRVTGGPDWINRTAFAVEGLAPGRATQRELRLMLQTLLEERFALKMRTEMTRVDMLTLVMGRSDGTLGPKVKTWSGSCPKVMPVLYFQAPRRALQNGPPPEADDPAVAECPTGYRAGGITLDGVTMFTVAEVLSLPPGRALLGTIVADQTGLSGRYTMELDYPFPAQRPGEPLLQRTSVFRPCSRPFRSNGDSGSCRARGRSDSSWSKARNCLPPTDALIHSGPRRRLIAEDHEREVQL